MKFYTKQSLTQVIRTSGQKPNWVWYNPNGTVAVFEDGDEHLYEWVTKNAAKLKEKQEILDKNAIEVISAAIQGSLQKDEAEDAPNAKESETPAVEEVKLESKEKPKKGRPAKQK